jgi:hypothetical protein
MKRFRCAAFIAIVLMFFSLGNLFSQTALQTASPSALHRSRGDFLTLKIALAGPGDELYFWWGHIALIIEDSLTGDARFYDYGLFSFDNENFFLNFALGRLLYSCGVSSVSANINHYKEINRGISVYTLDLDAAKKEEIMAFVENNVLPENRDYYYHHFRDNCATRIRDIIDIATDGQFKEAFGDAPGRFTLREHVRRHTYFSPFFDWILNFFMGQSIDEETTMWEEMFLPSEIINNIENFYYTDAFGNERKLVVAEELLYQSVNRAPALDIPRKQWPQELIMGCIIAVIILALMILRRKHAKAGRIAMGITHSMMGLFWGGIGLLLFFMTFFTNHDYTYDNANLLYVNPLLLIALPLGIRMARGKIKTFRFHTESILKTIWTFSFFCGILSMLIKLLPNFYQQNIVDQALYLPIAFMLSFIPHWLVKLALPFKRSKIKI